MLLHHKEEELSLQMLCVIFHLMQHFGCTSECVHMRTSLRLFHSLFLMVSSRSFVIEVALSHVHDAEEEEQIIALRPKADFPRCTGQSQVRMRLEGMTLCMQCTPSSTPKANFDSMYVRRDHPRHKAQDPRGWREE